MEIKYACIIDGVENAYPDKIAAVVVLGGSALKTEFGFFGPLAIPIEDCSEMSVESLLAHLNMQKATNEAIIITGSEPLQQYEALSELIPKLKANGFLVMLETTGFYADKLKELLSQLDGIAMDMKCELNADKMALLTGFRGEPATLMQDTLRSIGMLRVEKAKRPEFYVEFRTTIIPRINDSLETMESICKEIPFADKYALQQFISESRLADDELRQFGSTQKPALIELAVHAKKFIKKVVVRTKEEGEQAVE